MWKKDGKEEVRSGEEQIDSAVGAKYLNSLSQMSDICPGWPIVAPAQSTKGWGTGEKPVRLLEKKLHVDMVTRIRESLESRKFWNAMCKINKPFFV